MGNVRALTGSFSFEERKHMKEDKDTKFGFSWFYFLGTVLVILKALNLHGSGHDGVCDYLTHQILISNLSDWDETEDRKAEYTKQTLRHEIIHAFLFESGLGYNSEKTEHWAMNEEMTDFFALQFPKIIKAMKKAGAL